MNLPEARLGDLLKALPALRNPTVSHLANREWVAVETIIDEKVVREIISLLKGPRRRRHHRVSTQQTRLLTHHGDTMKEGIVKVGGADYRWSVFRQPTWATGRHEEYALLGLAILVVPPEPSRRELLLEFDIDPSRHGDMPQHQRFRIREGRLIEAIEDAIRSGWDPDSRGKRFVHEAGPLQPR